MQKKVSKEFEGQTKASTNNFSPKLMEALQQQFRVPSMFSWSFVYALVSQTPSTVVGGQGWHFVPNN